MFRCKTCDALRDEVTFLRQQNADLLDRIQSADWGRYKSAVDYEKYRDTETSASDPYIVRDPTGTNLIESYEEPPDYDHDEDD